MSKDGSKNGESNISDSIAYWILRKVVRLVFGGRYISVKGEADVPLRFPPAEYPALLRGPSKSAPKLRREWSKLLGNDEKILDIGANIGVTVQRFYSILDGKCCIWAFEPIPRNFNLLEINSRVLGSDRIYLFNSAVGNYDGEAVFADNLDHGGLSRIATTVSASRRPGFWSKTTEVKVKMITLDTFLDSHPDVCPTFVKIDVEGAGALVLRGAKNMLNRYKPVISCEFHSSGEDDEQTGISQIVKETGYRGIIFPSIEDEGFCWCAPEDSKGTFIHPSDPRLERLNVRDSYNCFGD